MRKRHPSRLEAQLSTRAQLTRLFLAWGLAVGIALAASAGSWLGP